MNLTKTVVRFEAPLASSYTSQLDCRRKCYFPGSICNEANRQCIHTHTTHPHPKNKKKEEKGEKRERLCKKGSYCWQWKASQTPPALLVPVSLSTTFPDMLNSHYCQTWVLGGQICKPTLAARTFRGSVNNFLQTLYVVSCWEFAQEHMHGVKQRACVLQAARCVPVNCTARQWKKIL